LQAAEVQRRKFPEFSNGDERRAFFDIDDCGFRYRGIAVSVGDQGMSWLDFMYNRFKDFHRRRQRFPEKFLDYNVDEMATDELKELVRALQVAYDVEADMRADLETIIKVDVDNRSRNQELYVPPTPLKQWAGGTPTAEVTSRPPTDWKTDVERSGPFQSFSDMMSEDEVSGQRYTWERRNWKCAGTHGLVARRIDTYRKGSGRWVCTDCNGCNRSVRMFFVTDSGWFIEKAGKHTHEPRPKCKQMAAHTEKNGIHALWTWYVDFALNLKACPARILEELTDIAGDDTVKLSLLPTRQQIEYRKKYLDRLKCAFVPSRPVRTSC
jgi:hypothetical protein